MSYFPDLFIISPLLCNSPQQLAFRAIGVMSRSAKWPLVTPCPLEDPLEECAEMMGLPHLLSAAPSPDA